MGDPNVSLIQDDSDRLDKVKKEYDIAIYCHTIEALCSPKGSLLKARKLAKEIVIRSFEPPEFETDAVELRNKDVGEGKEVPYIRRKMSRDYYRLILSKIGCTSVDVYPDGTSKDQVHELQYKA